MRKRILSVFLVIVLMIGVADHALAATISDIKKQQQETQQKLDSIGSSIGDLEDEKEGIDAEIDELDSTLVEVLASISLMEEDIEAKKEEIKIAEAEYDEAVENEKEQYKAMKMRIKFMYEKGDKTYAQLFFEAKSLGDMVNKAEYIEKLYEYDRKLLIEFQDIKQKVAELKEKLETEESELEAAQFELEEEKAVLEEMLAERKEAAKDYEVQLARARQEAAAYKALIKQQAAQIKQLEAEEAKRRAAEEAAKKKNNSSTSSGSKETYTPSAAAANFDKSMIDKASGSSKGKEIAKFGCNFIGNPYVAGGTSLTNGADCSGFTQAVYKNFGYSIPRNSTAQRSYGTGVELSQAEPGDIVCYAGHVAIYIGNGLIVHASTAKTGIKISNVTYRPILSVRRIV